MRGEQIRIRQLKLNDDCRDAKVMDCTDVGSQPDGDVDGQVFSCLAITVGLLASGCCLAWESGRELLHLMANPASTDVAIVALTLQMVASLLPGLSCAVIYLSWRRNPPWFFSAGAICLIGFVTAVAEMCVYASK